MPVKRILTGTAPEQAASRESLANPTALDYFVSLVDEYAGADPRVTGRAAGPSLSLRTSLRTL